MTIMTTGGATTGAVLIKTAYAPGFTEGIDRNNDLVLSGIVPPATPAIGDTAYRFKIHGGVNSSVEVFTEGQAEPPADSQEWYDAAVNWVYLRCMLQISGNMRDAMGSNWGIGLDQEAVQAREDMIDYWTQSWIGSTYGLRVAVDSSSTYAGITRGSAPYFESYEAAVSAAIANSNLQTMYDTLVGSNIGAKPSVIACPINQKTRIYNLQSTGMKMFPTNDPNAGGNTLTWNGIPVMGLKDLTTTELFMLDTRPGKIIRPRIRDWQVEEVKSGDSKVYAMTYGDAVVFADTMRQGKLTGLTA